MPSGTTVHRPEIARGAFTRDTIRTASTHVGTICVNRTRFAALLSLQFGTRVLRAAHFGGPVVGRVVTLATVTPSIAVAITIAVAVMGAGYTADDYGGLKRHSG